MTDKKPNPAWWPDLNPKGQVTIPDFKRQANTVKIGGCTVPTRDAEGNTHKPLEMWRQETVVETALRKKLLRQIRNNDAAEQGCFHQMDYCPSDEDYL